MISDAELNLYWEQFRKKPQSPVFALLVEGLRQRRQLEKALEVGQQGIAHNPAYHGGYLALARVYLDLEKYPEAVTNLKRALELNPQNTLALKLLAEVYLLMKDLQNALRTYKMAAFLGAKDPQLEAKLQSLETYQASQWDGWQKGEIFEKNQNSPIQSETNRSSPVTQAVASQTTPTADKPVENIPNRAASAPSQLNDPQLPKDFYLQRQLSYIQALMHRGELWPALERINQLEELYPRNPDLDNLKNQILKELDSKPEPVVLRPAMDRYQEVLKKKVQWLQSRLKVIAWLRMKAVKGAFTTDASEVV